ncbi:c6 transcription factor [Colletotrichum incanum]|uniref:C6 transcription factor n=1 Tax=Colletotrichum incanum TaxID=1573173 RepID=A0A166QVK2_COLIC|nr:c6 transcription factor [Colletotrichum incanum]
MHTDASNWRIGKQALYQCPQCQRQYHRTEHLARHVRSIHTKQRPYPCRSCGKAFGRLDILKRHEMTHGDESMTQLLDVGDRVSQACKMCKAAKVKCSERKPCVRCTGKGMRCEYEGVQEDAGGIGEIHEEQQQQYSIMVEGVSTGENISSKVNRALNDASLPNIPSLNSLNPYAAQDTPMHEEDPYMAGDSSFEVDWDLAMTGLAYLQDQHDVTGTDTAVTLDLAPNVVQQQPLLTSSPATGETPSVTGSWEPQSSENIEMERSHLAADEANLKPPKARRVTPGTSTLAPILRLSAAARNSIVSMILNNTSRVNAVPVLTAFPSTGALDALVGVYARDCETARINDIVHLPTLELERQRPELLGVVVATGAIEAGSMVARKFGFAMQEVVWVSLFRSWEGNNADLRDISLSQAFFLQQHIAFFSGIRRKVAFAEACSNTMQVLIKNGGHLQGAMRPDDDFSLSDLLVVDGQSLEDVWRRWSARESQRRLVYAAYIMDAHVSMAHGTQTLSSCSNMKIPFPVSRKLWKAETAGRWREEMLLLRGTSGASPTLCLSDIMGDPTLVAKHRALVDPDFVVLGFLAGHWALVKECQQLAAISDGMSGPWSSMILSARRVELSSMLKLFTSQVQNAGFGISPEAELLIEVLHMHALAPLGGSRPQEESSPGPFPTSAYDTGVLETTEHRRALWRAGRTVRAAVQFPAGTLCDIYAIAVFQAATLLWRHGVFSSQARGRDPSPEYVSGVFILDGDEAPEYQVLSKDTRLALFGLELEPVMLEDPAGVVRRIRGVVEHNWRDSRMPSGVEEVCRTLETL